MSDNLVQAVDQIWRESNPQAAAARLAIDLPSNSKQELATILVSLCNRLSASRVLRSGAIPTYAKPNEAGSVDTTQAAGLLLLLMLGVHHSDSLIELPGELREGRLKSWAKQTGIAEDLVREVAALGPAGLVPLIREARASKA